MPKSKAVVSSDSSSSDSDSGPAERAPPPKKSKDNESSKKESKKSSTSSKEPATTKWQLEKTRYVNITEFRGRKFIDIREFYEKNGEELPGKKGIALSLQQWKTLLEHADEITAAIVDQ